MVLNNENTKPFIKYNLIKTNRKKKNFLKK